MGSWRLSWSHNVESLRHFRACGSYQDFLDGMLLLLTRKLQNRRFLVVLFKSSIRKIYGRHHDLVNRYGVSVTNDDGNISFVVTEYCHKWRREYFVCCYEVSVTNDDGNISFVVTEYLSQMTTGIFRLLLRVSVTNDDGNISFVVTEYLSQMTKGIFCLFVTEYLSQMTTGIFRFVVTEYLSQMTTGIFRSLLRSICHKWRREYFVCLLRSICHKWRREYFVRCYGVSVTNDDGNISFVVTEYLSQMTTGIFRLLLRSICHNWRREYFACRGHNPVISSFITHHRIFLNKSNTTGDTGWEGTAYLPGAPEFNPKILVRFFLCNLQFSV